jgi:organic hydroperoxide reductase OsmC/OhrA
MSQGPEDAPKEFHMGVTWDGDAAGSGVAAAADGSYAIALGGSAGLGGSGKGANPEELLLAAVGSCFISTWAIFLKKLGLRYAEPSIALLGELGKDPAGGFKMNRIQIDCRVPASLLSASRAPIEKSLQLAEKYCIISKVARSAMPVEVRIVEN